MCSFPAHLQPPTTKVDPIPIPSWTPPSRQSSAMAMSTTADPWLSGISCSKPRDDVVMTSRPPSPIRRYSSDRPAVPQGARPIKDTHAREMTDLKRRDSTEMVTKDHLVSKLYDLLDSPRPTSSLHAHMQHRTDFPESTLPQLPRVKYKRAEGTLSTRNQRTMPRSLMTWISRCAGKTMAWSQTPMRN